MNHLKVVYPYINVPVFECSVSEKLNLVELSYAN